MKNFITLVNLLKIYSLGFCAKKSDTRVSVANISFLLLLSSSITAPFSYHNIYYTYTNLYFILLHARSLNNKV